MRNLKKIVAAAGLVCLHMAGSAAVIVTEGTDNTGTDNVIFNACDPGAVLTGTTVTGCLNSAPGTFVNLTGLEELTVTGGGQAKIEATDGSYNYLQIEMASASLGFTKVLFNITTDKLDATGDITISAILAGGGSFTSSLYSLANGENKFIVESTDGDIMKSVSFTSSTGVTVLFEDTKQVRIGGVLDPSVCPPGTTGTPPNCVPDPNSVPEPGSLALVGLALAAAGGVARRRRA